MSPALLELPEDVEQAIWHHLFRDDLAVEQAGFVFARGEVGKRRHIFRYIEWLPIPPAGFAIQSEFHLELTDEMRAAIIKRAHDLGACLVEFHSHAGPWPAAFSPSDFAGLREFVPHVWWRLKGKPYLAVVVASSGFDGLVWRAHPSHPERLTGLIVNGEVRAPTRLTRLADYYDE